MSAFNCRPSPADPVVSESSQALTSAEVPADGRTAKVVHTIEDIQRELAHGRIPITDNVDALVALGFSPDRPQDARDTTWSRAVESADLRGGYKHQIIERAELIVAVKFAIN